ncbi:MAG: ABC transporter substrate-binding protein [Syntrophorhabdales bacterium]|jgi:ABC-type transport system substrate-binding protein
MPASPPPIHERTRARRTGRPLAFRALAPGYALCAARIAALRLRARITALARLRITAFSFFACALVLTLAACGNNPYPSDAPALTGYTALTEDPRTLDPAQVSDTNSAEILDQIYDSLYQNAYLDRPYHVEPALAAGYPEKRTFSETVKEKGVAKTVTRMEYTFRLKDDIFFQDDPCFPGGHGRRVTANDVIYSIKRLADPTVQATGYWLVAGKIKGMDDYFKKAAARGRADYSEPVEGLSAPDARTLRITLTEPYPAFIYVMSIPYTAPVAHEAVDYYNAPGRDGFSRHPVGTGAYRLKLWRRQHRIILARNPTFRPDYYPATGAPGDRADGLLEDAGKRLPFLDEVWYTIISAGQPVWLLFLQGYLDASGIPQEQFDKVVTKSLELSDAFMKKGITLEIASDLDVHYIAFNMRDPILGKNKYLRQALSLAYDSDLFNDIYLNGRAIVAQGPLPPGVFGFDPAFKNPYHTHDLGRAKELLAKAGYPGGIDPKTGGPLELTYDIGSDSVRAREAATFDMRCFEQLGIRMRLQVNTFSQYLERTIKGTFQMTSSGWLADYPDPENFLQLLYGPNAPPNPNSSSFANAEYDRLYERIKTMEDTPERAALIHRMVEIVTEECPWIFNVHTPSYVLRHSWCKNGKSHSISGNYRKYPRIDVAARDAYRTSQNRPAVKPLVYAAAALVAFALPAFVRASKRRRRGK